MPTPPVTEDALMKIALPKPLFAWDELEDSPSLSTLKELLELFPDAEAAGIASSSSRQGTR